MRRIKLPQPLLNIRYRAKQGNMNLENHQMPPSSAKLQILPTKKISTLNLLPHLMRKIKPFTMQRSVRKKKAVSSMTRLSTLMMTMRVKKRPRNQARKLVPLRRRKSNLRRRKRIITNTTMQAFSKERLDKRFSP